jgi:hypothetical protein
VSSLEESLPAPFAAALAHLRKDRDPDAKVDAIKDNFAYVWVANISKNTSEEQAGGWIRVPLAFPYANPHGLVTRDALKRRDGGAIADAYNPNHETCAPVRSVGAAHYYSWTWVGAPPLRSPEDIIGVVQWYERRIRNG